MHINQEKDKIISEYLLGNLSKQEMQELGDEIDGEFLVKLMKEDDIVERYESFAKADTEKALRKALNTAYPPSVISFRWKIAAIMLCVIAIGAYFWYHDYSQITPPTLAKETEDFMLKALEKQCVTDSEDAPQSSGTAYRQDINPQYLHSFHLSASTAEEMLHAENITTYHDKEHWLKLDDGTIVHLNRNTRIIYPEHFPRFSHREVVIDGDAYFMVAHDKSRRFIVHTQYGDVTDYGTEFFVTSKQELEVALINGSAGVMPKGRQETLLTPGQKATLTQSGDVIVGNIDVEEYKAWNTGKFAFAGKDLQTVMSIISRWYGINVYYGKEEYRHILITGNYDRCPDVMPLLESLEYVTGLHFSYVGNTIEIR